MARLLIRRLLPLAMAVGSLGCGAPPLLQVETTVRSDGSCDRSIWQPKDKLLPGTAFSPAWTASWTTVVDVRIPPAFADQSSSSGGPYFHAAGRFSSPAAIPPHFRKEIEARPDLGAGELIPSWRRIDYGLFAEHLWTETLTNNVTRRGFEEARDAFLDLALPILAEGIQKVYGEEFDVDAAAEEFSRRGRPLFRDLLDAWYDGLAASESATAAGEILSSKLLSAVERAGIDLHDAQGGRVSSAEGERRVREFLAARILADFRRRDGEPPTSAEIDEVLAGKSSPRYSKAWSDFAAGRKEEFEAKLVPLIVEMTGYYAYPPIFSPPMPRFAFAVQLPGKVVADGTNGDVDTSGRVSWRFDATRLFPSGFRMSARSIELNQAAQHRLLGRVVIEDAAIALAVREILADDPGLANAVIRACEAGNTGLIRDHPESSDESKSSKLRLEKLLGIVP